MWKVWPLTQERQRSPCLVKQTGTVWVPGHIWPKGRSNSGVFIFKNQLVSLQRQPRGTVARLSSQDNWSRWDVSLRRVGPGPWALPRPCGGRPL